MGKIANLHLFFIFENGCLNNLEELSSKVGLSVSTLYRFETNEQSNIAYQDLVKLAKYYNVSIDYLSGLTNHGQYRNIAIDELALTDDVVAVLKSKKANNRLISELLAHEDFPKLLSSMEVYIDRKILLWMTMMKLLHF